MKLGELTYATRHLKRYKKYSLLNVLGLSLGMASAMFILLWGLQELQVDKFHKDGSNIYVMRMMLKYSDDKNLINTSMSPYIGPLIQKEIPEIEEAIRLSKKARVSFRLNEKKSYEKGYYADSDFFKVFSFPLIIGNKRDVLRMPNSVVISEELAVKYFGGTNVLGKIINISDKKEELFTIIGVFKKVALSSLQFDFILPYAKFHEYYNDQIYWDNHNVMSFVKVKPNSNIELLGEKITEIYLKNSSWKLPVLFLQPFEDWYLYNDYDDSMHNPTGRILYVKIFLLGAFFIILLACMNYINMSTAIATKRLREVGVKKAFGSSFWALLKQFTLEAAILTVLAFLLSGLMVKLFLPYLNVLLNINVELNFLNGKFVGTLLLVPVLTGILSGVFPSLYLSSFKPIPALKKLRNYKLNIFNLRQLLVVFQFTMTIVFIISSLLVLEQIKFIQNKSLGVDKNNVVTFQQSVKIMQNREAFKWELKKNPEIINVSYTTQSPINVGASMDYPVWEGKNVSEIFNFPYIIADEDFCKTFNIKILQGRDFSNTNSLDRYGILINQQFASLMGVENPVGKIVTFWGRKAKILGVTNDFHLGNMRRPLQQLIIICRPENTTHVMVKINSKQKKDALKIIQDVFNDFDKNVPFEYEFISGQYDKSYESEKYLGQFANTFTILAILISCLGLFGLALFTAEQKAKEIGIRKSVGAKTYEIIFMITEGFMKWIVIAFLMASLLAYSIIQKWFETFVYHAEISWWVFIFTGIIITLIGLVTFSWQAYRAASKNPVESLRYE